MGGEKEEFRCKSKTEEGSPPRGRGKDFFLLDRLLAQRITPAWAGKSRGSGCRIDRARDHPRVGGEKPSHYCELSILGGSPPRGRGKAIPFLVGGFKLRITPAWAGKSCTALSNTPRAWDHPRVGGEKARDAQPSGPRTGSPPRGRGKVHRYQIGPWLLGITPAWAGKRLKRSHRSGIFISGPIPFHSVLHRPAGSGGSRAGRDGSLAGQPQNAGPA